MDHVVQLAVLVDARYTEPIADLDELPLIVVRAYALQEISQRSLDIR
jgi:hypothetical protein